MIDLTETPAAAMLRRLREQVRAALGAEFFVIQTMGRTPEMVEYELNKKYPDGHVGCFGSYQKRRFCQMVQRLAAMKQDGKL